MSLSNRKSTSPYVEANRTDESRRFDREHRTHYLIQNAFCGIAHEEAWNAAARDCPHDDEVDIKIPGGRRYNVFCITFRYMQLWADLFGRVYVCLGTICADNVFNPESSLDGFLRHHGIHFCRR